MVRPLFVPFNMWSFITGHRSHESNWPSAGYDATNITHVKVGFTETSIPVVHQWFLTVCERAYLEHDVVGFISTFCWMNRLTLCFRLFPSITLRRTYPRGTPSGGASCCTGCCKRCGGRFASAPCGASLDRTQSLLLLNLETDNRPLTVLTLAASEKIRRAESIALPSHFFNVVVCMTCTNH